MSGMKNLDYAFLLEVYGCMLTDRQRELMEFYYWEDMSLGETAEYLGITRQAVRDGIKRGEQTLILYEQKLMLAEKIAKCREIFDTIIESTSENRFSAASTENIKNIHEAALRGRELVS